jgi:hypothetical protein
MMAPDIPEVRAERPKEVQHDESPSGITDHPFTPKGLWYTLCSRCNLAESAHAETTNEHPIRISYVADDMVEDD